MKKIKTYLFNKKLKTLFSLVVPLLTLLTLSFYSNGQGVTIRAGIDSIKLLLGDQVKIHFEVTQNKDFKVSFPEFKDSIINKIELLESYKPDTTWLTNNQFKVTQEYLVTCFDTGFYYFPAFKFPVKNGFLIDTMKSEPFYAEVFAIPVDTTKGIFDIKKPYQTPLTFREVLPYAGYGLLGAAIIAAAIYYFRKRKKNEPVLRRVRPKLPPHTVAFDELDKLKAEKLWQQGLIKEYFSRLTDIIRIYIEDRFAIKAMELITNETLEFFKLTEYGSADAYYQLKELLKLADLVKFAKGITLPDENELMFRNAWDFVRQTKPVIQIDQKQEDKENPDSAELEKETASAGEPGELIN